MTESAHHDDHLPPKSSIKRWLVTTNHKDVGILYLLTSIAVLVIGGVLALLMRIQLWTPGSSIMAAYAYNEAVTIHGLLMVFWFLSPIAVGFANYIVPLQIGADDLAFPRLNALSYWLYLASAVMVILSFFVDAGSLATGWTMYAPLNLPTFNVDSLGGTIAVMALMLFVISVTIGTVNFLTTIHHSRAKGMGMWDMPMFTWGFLLTAWMMLFAFAALLTALMILGADRIVGTVYFTPEASGSLLWAHLWWFFGHPEVYIVFFPALGIMFEVFQTFAGRRIVGRKWVIIAMILVAVQSFVVWMHHMFLTAINLEIKTLMMATTIGISLPFDLMVFALIYTLVKGRIRYTTPFLFNLGALVLFIIGGITGVFLGAIVLDYELRGTYWVVAHFHYVMASGVTALIGGLYYWYPKITGKMYNKFLGKLHFAVYFIGFNLLYFTQFTGWETPRRVFEYAPHLTLSHQLSTIGAAIFGASFLIMFYNLSKSYFHGPDADGNPWKYSQTAEWATESPPPLENWPGRASYESGSLEFVESETAAADGGTVPGGGTVSAGQEEHVDHASWWPVTIAAGAFVMFFGISGLGDGSLLYQALSVVGVVLFLGACWGFGRESFHYPSPDIAERWPFEGISKTKLGVWFFLASDIVVFGALIGAFVFMRISYGWEDWAAIAPSAIPGLVNTLVLLTSSYFVVMALVAAEHGNKRRLFGFLSGTVVLGLTFLTVKAWEWSVKFSDGVYPSTSTEASVFYLTTSLHGLHVILGLLVAGFMLLQIYRADAYLGDPEPVEHFGLYWHFVDIVWVFLFPLFYLM